MAERTMTEIEFTRTTYDPVLTEKLGQIVNAYGLVEELTPPQPKTLDEIAFGFNMNEVELIASGNGTLVLHHKNRIATQLERVSAEEIQQATTTNDFLEKQEKAESEFDSFPYFPNRSHSTPYISAYMWPRERAFHKARALSLDETSGISTSALKRVNDMHVEADNLNRAYDVIASNGADIEIPYKRDRSPEGDDLRGDNWIGRGTVRKPVLKVRGRIYDIQNGTAVRWSQEQERYVPFAEQYQGRAINAMRKAAIKGMDRRDDLLRAEAVKKAKETLGRAGVRIPKYTV